jgi:hypothetical protein
MIILFAFFAKYLPRMNETISKTSHTNSINSQQMDIGKYSFCIEI